MLHDHSKVTFVGSFKITLPQLNSRLGMPNASRESLPHSSAGRRERTICFRIPINITFYVRATTRTHGVGNGQESVYLTNVPENRMTWCWYR